MRAGADAPPGLRCCALRHLATCLATVGRMAQQFTGEYYVFGMAGTDRSGDGPLPGSWMARTAARRQSPGTNDSQASLRLKEPHAATSKPLPSGVQGADTE